MLFEKNILQLLHKKYLHQQPEAQNFRKRWKVADVFKYDKDRNERLALKTCSIMLQKTGHTGNNILLASPLSTLQHIRDNGRVDK